LVVIVDAAFFAFVVFVTLLIGALMFWLHARKQAAHQATLAIWTAFFKGREKSSIFARMRLQADGSRGTFWTTLWGSFEVVPLGSFSCSPRNQKNEASNKNVSMQDAVFDERYEVTCSPDGVATRVFNSEVRRNMLAFAASRQIELHYKKGRLELCWPGPETNPEKLESAVRLLETVAAQLEHRP
jgi:hypothetical protein